MSEPQLRIKGKLHAYPSSSKLGDAALIELLTGLTHGEWRTRYRASLQAAVEAGDDGSVDEDSAVSIGVVALAVQRANPRWPRSRVVEFVNDLDWDDVEFVGGDDAGPPDSSSTPSPNGSESASQSSSGSDTDSSESTTLQPSGHPTSAT